MKQLLSKLCAFAKQLLSSKTCSSVKEFISSRICKPVKQWWSSGSADRVKQLFSSKRSKLLVLMVVLLLVLAIGLSKCSGGKTLPEETVLPTEGADTSETLPEADETGTPAATATMGTITADMLNVRKGPGSDFEKSGSYTKGDRIEILETQTADDTTWGRTNLGWIGMGYVRMDGTANPDANPAIISNKNTDVLGYGVVDLKELNVRLGPGTDYDIIGTVSLGIRHAYYQVSSAYENWVRIDSGWVSTEHFYLEGTVAEDALTGTVTTPDLNIRTGPSTNFQSVSTCQLGETVEILAQVGTWGYTEKGWISMNYVEPNEPVYSTGECIVNRGLNVRQEPNADSEIVATLKEGNIVTVLEVQGGWGRTVQGWINLKYVDYK